MQNGGNDSGVAALAGATGAAPPPLEWKFGQVFGERAAGEEVQEGKPEFESSITHLFYNRV